MSLPKYYVTYVVMGTDAGANPFGHACLVFSQQDEERGPIKVIDSFGFYSQPSTTTNPVIKAIKELLGLKVDLQEGHGVLKKEKMYELDGNGLHGKSYELTEEQFQDLERKYKDEMRLEFSTIKELNKELKKEANGHTRFVKEKQLHPNNPRLHPFHFELKPTWHGLDSSGSYTCKNRALDLLTESGIIDAAERGVLNGGVALSAFPRCKGDALTPIRLVSTGDVERTQSERSARVFFNRTFHATMTKPKNSLFFASSLNLHTTTLRSPEEVEAEEQTFVTIKTILTQARQVENSILRNIDSIHDDHQRKRALFTQSERIKALYPLFQNIHDNYDPVILTSNLNIAKNHINIATMALTPNRVDSYFLVRYFESVFARHALLGLIGVIVSAPLIGGVMGSALFVAAALYTLYNLHGLYKEEMHFSEMRKDYKEYMTSINDTSRLPAPNQTPGRVVRSLSTSSVNNFGM